MCWFCQEGVVPDTSRHHFVCTIACLSNLLLLQSIGWLYPTHATSLLFTFLRWNSRTAMEIERHWTVDRYHGQAAPPLTLWSPTTPIGVVPNRWPLKLHSIFYSTNIGTEYFKRGIYFPFFSSSKCSLFHNSNVFGSCVIHILYTGCAKIKKNNSGAKRLSTPACVVLFYSSCSSNLGVRCPLIHRFKYCSGSHLLKKARANLVQSWTRPEGSRRLALPDFGT